MSTSKVANGFRPVGGGFELQYAGEFIRVWCGACDKHDLIPDDDLTTVDERKTSHRCGARTSAWERGDL